MVGHKNAEERVSVTVTDAGERLEVWLRRCLGSRSWGRNKTGSIYVPVGAASCNMGNVQVSKKGKMERIKRRKERSVGEVSPVPCCLVRLWRLRTEILGEMDQLHVQGTLN